MHCHLQSEIFLFIFFAPNSKNFFVKGTVNKNEKDQWPEYNHLRTGGGNVVCAESVPKECV